MKGKQLSVIYVVVGQLVGTTGIVGVVEWWEEWQKQMISSPSQSQTQHRAAVNGTLKEAQLILKIYLKIFCIP